MMNGKQFICRPSLPERIYRQLDWANGNITMAGVFGKDPNMKRKGSREELDRIMAERARNKEAAAARFKLKKPAAASTQKAETPKT
jgi:hypothetical protein